MVLGSEKLKGGLDFRFWGYFSESGFVALRQAQGVSRPEIGLHKKV